MMASALRRVTLVLMLVTIVLGNILRMHSTLLQQQEQGTRAVDDSPESTTTTMSSSLNLTSGVVIVTTDGAWGGSSPPGRRLEDVKILGFTDRNYLPIAKMWYTRLSILGYTEHYVVAHDKESYDSLTSLNMRALPCLIDNPEYHKQVKGLGRQIMSSRLHFTMEMLKNGTHVLVTDIDNVFSRYVNPQGFLEEGYDVYHAYEMKFPKFLYKEFGFLVCGGHHFFRSSPETLRFMDIVAKHCPVEKTKCNDQIIYNQVLFHDLGVKWDKVSNPAHAGALRLNTTNDGGANAMENNNLLLESVTGRSYTTNHTIKIWDRDFAWRLAGGLPEHCPSKNNWVGMPTKQDVVPCSSNVDCKLKSFAVWDELCATQFNSYSAASS